MLIRPEAPGDEDAIDALTALAFAPMPFSDGAEPGIIRQLRRAGHLSVSLVAIVDDELVGHVAISPATVGDATAGWYGLGPISVHPRVQRHGIGSALVRAGLDELRSQGAVGCALIGNEKVYGPMGFISGRVTHGELAAPIVQYVVLDGSAAPEGELRFAPAFDGH